MLSGVESRRTGEAAAEFARREEPPIRRVPACGRPDILALVPDAIPRPTARILIVDGNDRILLFRALGPTKNPDYAWFTPGGGAHPGEELAEAAVRELREETGYRVAPEAMGPVVAFTSGHWEANDGTLYHAEDSFFFLRVPEFDVDLSGMEEFESTMFDSFRWWSLADLRATPDRVAPLQLADLLERLLKGDIPAQPVIIPWGAIPD
ncbi:hypothetical protein GCM10009555_070220 [Acrocarpospora macrocephala]|uniref:Nudix hydrolase domain-containing protein n=1 Tax=Acrocarpospora macrocephala TaxID=150177 RepID=A0A5M3WXF3_9ACTN|nr:hypothetical protein Amac_066630 [Acrocarpospora macrocephala]